MVILAVKMVAKDGEADGLRNALVELTAPSQAEPGCLDYEPARDPSDPNAFFLFERWADQEAFEAHQASEHFQRWAVNDLLQRVGQMERLTLAPL